MYFISRTKIEKIEYFFLRNIIYVKKENEIINLKIDYNRPGIYIEIENTLRIVYCT